MLFRSNNPQTVFQKYSNVIEILQFFDFGQQSFFQFYINLSNRCLKKKLSFHSLKACLINLYKTEKIIAVRNQRIAEFQLHWSTFEKLFEDC